MDEDRRKAAVPALGPVTRLFFFFVFLTELGAGMTMPALKAGKAGNGESVPEPHLLAGTLIDEFIAVTEKFPEFANFPGGDITGRDDVEPERVTGTC